MEFTARPVASTSSEHGEGPIWDQRTGRLLWVDITGCKVNVFDPLTEKNSSVSTVVQVGTVVPCRDPNLAAVALRDGFAKVDLVSGKIDYLQKMNLPGARFNDGKADPAGRFWAGTMADKHTPGSATLYRLDADHSLHTLLANVTVSNGIVWTRDHKIMYYIDTPTGQVDAFDYDNATGAIANRRRAVKIPPGIGGPDGMTIDTLDRLWVALWGGSRVCCFDPRSGEILHTVHTPGARNSSACALGGPDLDELFISTSQQGVKPEDLAPGGPQPDAGRLFRTKVPATGLPVFTYAG